MRLDGAFADPQATCDLFVRKTLPYQAENLSLPRRQVTGP